MATIRTENDLISSCQNNTTGDITASTLRDIIASAWNRLDNPDLGEATTDASLLTTGTLDNARLSSTVVATLFSGSGASLTSLPAANLTGSLPAISGASLTSLTASVLTGSLPAISGASLTSLTASALTGALPAISGALLTTLNASNISSGTLSNSRLSGVALTASANTFSVAQTIYDADGALNNTIIGLGIITVDSGSAGDLCTITGRTIAGARIANYSEKLTSHGNTTGAKTINCALSAIHSLTLTGNTTYTFSNAPTSGDVGTLTLIVTGNGSATQTFPAAVNWGTLGAPSVVSTTTIMSFVTVDAGTVWRGSWIGGY